MSNLTMEEDVRIRRALTHVVDKALNDGYKHFTVDGKELTTAEEIVQYTMDYHQVLSLAPNKQRQVKSDKLDFAVNLAQTKVTSNGDLWVPRVITD